MSFRQEGRLVCPVSADLAPGLETSGLFRSAFIGAPPRARTQNLRIGRIQPPRWRMSDIQGRIGTQNGPLDFDRDYLSRQMLVIAGETRGDGRKIT